MNDPVLTTRAAFGVSPRVVPTAGQWYDLTADLLPAQGEIEIQRGSNEQLNSIRAGTASAVYSNMTNRFTNEYSSGPFYGFVRSGTRQEFYATYSNVVYPLYTGFWEDLEYSAAGKGALAFVKIDCVDGIEHMQRISNASITSPVYQLSGARMQSLLTARGWPSGDIMTNLNTTGSVVVLGDPDYDFPSVSLLDELKETNKAEAGTIFIAKDGKFTLQPRSARLMPSGLPPLFSDDGTGYPYKAYTASKNNRMTFNRARFKAKPVDRKQTVTLTSATGGTFTLKYSSRTTSALAYNASATDVYNALAALKTLKAKGLEYVLNPSAGVYEVYFADGYGDLLLVANGTSLTGTSPTIGITTHTGVVQEAYDSTSIAAYGDRFYGDSSEPIEVIVTSDAEALNLANEMVRRYKDELTRIRKISPEPYKDPTMWPTVLSADIGTPIRVRRTINNFAVTVTMFIEGITIRINRNGHWSFDWQLSPAFTPTNVFILGDATYGDISLYPI